MHGLPYKADPVRGAEWAELFARKMPEMPFRIWPDIGDPREVRYLAAWQPPEDLATRFPNLNVLFSTGAGTDHVDYSVIPETLPVVRMVESGIVNGMVEYVRKRVDMLPAKAKKATPGNRGRPRRMPMMAPMADPPEMPRM